MKGAILERGVENKTRLTLFLPIIRDKALRYNWLLTNIDSNYSSENLKKRGYEFLSGEEFVDLMEKNEVRFIWGVFSAFPPNIKLNEIVSEGIPFADGYMGFWGNRVTMQNPLSVIEMVFWDGMIALIISRDDQIVNKFLELYKLSENLEVYNSRK